MRQQMFAATVLLTGFLVSPWGAEPASQEPGQERPRAAFSARSELVVLHVMVKDRSGAYVTGLDRDAFTVLEDGTRQQIAFFEAHDAPVTVGLLADSSGSMFTARSHLAAAAGAFAESSNPDDELFALTFNEQVRAALPPDTPFTADAATLRLALADAFVSYGRTALYDAIQAGIAYLARGRHDVKVLIVVTDGGDNASTATFAQVLSAIQASNTVVYPIAVVDPLDLEASPRRLKRLAEVSGGEWFEPKGVARVDAVLRRIALDIRNTYTIGYSPENAVRDGRFRRIRVQVTAPSRAGLRVRTREGYVLGDR
jgi:VWFA-related protein